MIMRTTSAILLWGMLAARTSVSASRPTIASQEVWKDVALLKAQIDKYHEGQEHQNQQHEQQQHRDLQFGAVCDLIIEFAEDIAPSSTNRECKCSWFTQSLDCSYQQVTCKDKILPTLDIKFNLGVVSSKVEVCQAFAEQDTFDPVCIEADLTNRMEYETCTRVTMGGTECACEACEDGLTLDIDCSEHHPLAKTEGCQRVFFQDSCLDFLPTPIVAEPDLVPDDTEEDTGMDTEVDLQEPELEGFVPPDVLANITAGNNGTTPANAPYNGNTIDTEEVEEELVGNPFPARTFQQAAMLTGAPTFDQTEQLDVELTDGPTTTPVTPQQKANEWMQADPNLSTYSSTKRMQRYAMATLYYSTTEVSNYWFHSQDWLSYETDECDWFTNSSEYPCNSITGALEVLDLSENDLSGPLTGELGLLRDLKQMFLPYNFLTGTLPTEIGSLPHLVDLDLRATDLQGTLPSEIGLLTALESLSLQFNWMEGALPSELGLLTNAFALELFGNNFEGPFPSELCQLIIYYQTEVYIDCGTLNCTCGCICA